jgi:hypothetical protein
MKNMFGSKVREKLIELGKARPEEIIGCSKDEIEEIKASQNVSYLPPLYEDFLLIMGRHAGELFIGSDWYYPDLLKLKNGAETTPCELPDDAFILLDHQGYQFMFFRTASQNPDPEVYHYMESAVYYFTENYEGPRLDNPPIVRWAHLSEFLTGFIKDAQGKEAQTQFLSELKLL